jgi:hypothetical protein
MRSEPGIQLRGQDPGVAVSCPCGAELITLARGEGVYPVGTLMRQLGETKVRKGKCAHCAAEYSIPVTTMAEDRA